MTNAPIAYCNENMVDGRNSQEETMRGIKKRTFYLVYQAPEQSNRNHDYSKICKFDITDAEVEKARFILYFAVYLSQRYLKRFVTILTGCSEQKKKINRSHFKRRERKDFKLRK